MTKAILCPRCHRLIGSEEKTCSWCGTSRNSPFWRLITLSSGLSGGGGLVAAVITLNILMYVLALLISPKVGSSGNLLGLLGPDRTSLLLLGGTGTIPIDRFGRLWSLLSASYLHAGILHLLFNLMALRDLAPLVIREYGTSRMFVIYTIGGVGGFLLSYLAGVAFTVGASASICALVGALLYYGRSRGGSYGSVVYREVKGWIIGLVIIGLIMPGINNWGHAGGVLSGVVLGRVLGYEDRRAMSRVHAALAVCCVLAVLVALVLASVETFVLYQQKK